MKGNRVKGLLKCSHLLLSIALIVVSIAVFVGTLLMKSKYTPYTEYLNDYTSKPLLYLLVGSAVLIIAGFVGIVSVIQEWIRGIITFMLFILYLLISMIALVITAYILSTTVDERMYTKIKTDMINYDTNKEIVDNLQLKFTCCGVNNFTEWRETLGYIPGSCCNSYGFCDNSEMEQLRLPGCYESLTGIVKYFGGIIFPVLAAIGIVETLSIIISILLMCIIKRQRRKNPRLQPNNITEENVQLPRIHNTFERNTLPTIEITKSPILDGYREPVYVRRPIEKPIILAYKNPHANYLSRQPQYRFDFRRASQNINNSPPSSKIYDSSRY